MATEEILFNIQTFFAGTYKKVTVRLIFSYLKKKIVSAVAAESR